MALDFVGVPAPCGRQSHPGPFGPRGGRGPGRTAGASVSLPGDHHREAEIIGCSDHLAAEIPLLTELVRARLDLAPVITEMIPLDAAAINAAMDRLERYGAGGVRTVIEV